MDVRYRISGGVVSVSAPSALSPLSATTLDSKALRSEFEILATMARGSCGVDHRPLRLRITLSVSHMDDWEYSV